MSCTPSSPQQFGNILPVLSTDRPTGFSRYPGRVIFETDTLKTLVWDGTGWTILSEPLQTWTPTITGLTVGNGAWTSPRYHRSDGWCDVYGIFTLGTTSAVPGALSLNLPFAALLIPFSGIEPRYYDSSAGLVYGGLVGNGATSPTLFASTASGTYTSIANLSATIPFTWATGDQIGIVGRYPMATRYS